jgi:hypothetical protein
MAVAQLHDHAVLQMIEKIHILFVLRHIRSISDILPKKINGCEIRNFGFHFGSNLIKLAYIIIMWHFATNDFYPFRVTHFFRSSSESSGLLGSWAAPAAARSQFIV